MKQLIKNIGIKRIAKRSFLASKKRNFFTILTIALASALLSGILLYGIGTSQANINSVKNTAQIVYHGINQNQGNQLYENENVDWIGEFTLVSSEKIDGSILYIQYGNKEMFKTQNMKYEGNIPQKQDEIMLQRSFLESLGYTDEIGKTISIPFTDGKEHDFVLSGIINVEMGDIGSYMAIISKQYAENYLGENMPLDYYLGLKNAVNMSEEEAEQFAYDLGKEMGVEEEQIIVRSNYFAAMSRGLFSSEMLLYILIGFITLIGSGIVIYSIFYISIAENIRNYGQLRTIGATKRQIKKIVYREGKVLAFIGIPFGLIIGATIGYILIPAGWNWINSFFVMCVTGVFSYFIIILSIRTPVKKASSVSPMEALKYMPYNYKNMKFSTLNRKISTFALAKMNLFREKRKTILTIISLSIGGILLIVFTTLLMSYDGRAEVRGKDFPRGEFHILLDRESNNQSLSELQNENLLSNDFINELYNIEGVTDVYPWYYIDAICKVNGSEVKNVQGYSKDEMSAMEDNLISGTVDYDKLVKEKGVIMLADRADDGYCSAELGDKIEISVMDNQGKTVEESYTIMGIISNYTYAGFKKCFTMPIDLMNELTHRECRSMLEISCNDSSLVSVEEQLRTISDGTPELLLETFDESLTYYNYQQQFMNSVLVVIGICIAFFSFINLVNTTISNFLVRRREFGIMQAIGLTERQLKRILRWEGAIYALTTTVITFILGTGLGYLCYTVFKRANPYYFYKFPIIVLVAYFLTLLLIQIILTKFMITSLRRQSIVERINVFE